MPTKFYRDVESEISRLGGFYNAHLHLDRANTLDDGYVDSGNLSVLANSHISLQKKHALIATVHEGKAYTPEDLIRRVDETTEVMIAANTKTADTMVDVTDDCVGTSALHTLLDYAKGRAEDIKIRCASYTPLGFKDRAPGRWAVFEEGVKQADFIGSLPEADDRDDYPDNIGFEEHCNRMLGLVQDTGKMLHVHTDQLNFAAERGTERLIACMREMNMAPSASDETPLVWAIHMISPSTYDQKRYEALVDGLLECNIGVVSCPSAAIGMRQFRQVPSPTYNSIPRVLDMAARGVHIRLGSDNVADMCSPSTTANLMDEVFMLSAAERYFDPTILAKFATGVALNPQDRDTLRQHLELNDVEIEKRL